jgi:prepilin-type N-terminal cleavage/methylation domain-containing protein
MRAARWDKDGGFTLVELMISIAIMAALSVSLGRLVATCMRFESASAGAPAAYEQGVLAVERMVAGLKSCTGLQVPNNHSPSRELLAFSGTFNDDGDTYFGDALCPRVDEDAPSDMSCDSAPGLAGIDDDGDGLTDEAGGLAWADAVRDDDEDGAFDEDRLDGIDNDGDGDIDEDTSSDENADASPGVSGVDDDGDGFADEGGGAEAANDDEDGASDEDGVDAVLYTFDAATGTLREAFPRTGESGIVCGNVAAFTVTYTPPDATTDPYITISLTVSGESGETITIVEDVYPRNLIQKWGKRVR